MNLFLFFTSNTTSKMNRYNELNEQHKQQIDSLINSIASYKISTMNQKITDAVNDAIMKIHYQEEEEEEENIAEIYIDDNEKVMNVAFPIEPK